MINAKRAVLFAKLEAAYGTDPVPVAANAIVASDIKIGTDVAVTKRKARGASLSQFPAVAGQRSGTISFSVDLRGIGEAYAANKLPEISALMQACGYAETVDVTPGSESVEYAPVSTGFKSCTIYVYMDGILHKCIGAVGDVKFSAKVGEAAVATFTMSYLFRAPVDQAMLTPSYIDPTLAPPAFLSAGVDFGGYAAIISALEVGLGCTVGKRADANAPSGVAGFFISDRDPSGSIDPEAKAVATFAPVSALIAGTEQALSAVVGATQYNRIAIAAPKAQITKADMGDREGLATYALPLQLNRDAGDDELVITFN